MAQIITETTTRELTYFDYDARFKAISSLFKYEVISEEERALLLRRCEDIDRKWKGKPPIPEEIK